MNTLQQEYLNLRSGGLKPRAALTAMTGWRAGAAADIRRGPGLLPRPVADLLADLLTERERVACVRRLVDDITGVDRHP